MTLQKEVEIIKGDSWEPFVLNGKLIFSPPDAEGYRTITRFEGEPMRGKVEGAFRTNDADWEAFDGDIIHPGEIRKGVCVSIFMPHDNTHYVIPVHTIQLQAD